MRVIMYEIWKNEGSEIVLKEQCFNDKTPIIDFINNNTNYKVGARTPLCKMAYVLQPDYWLHRNGKRIYP